MLSATRRELILKWAGHGYKANEIAGLMKIPEAEAQAVIDHPETTKPITDLQFIEPPSFEGI